MTAQTPDRLFYKGELLPLHSNPLEQYWRDGGRPKFVSWWTANYRGYVATWEIRSDMLVLIELAGSAWEDLSGRLLTSDKHFMDEPFIDRTTDAKLREIALSDLFPACPNGVVALWFSGELKFPQGDLVRHEDWRHGGVHEYELVFTIQQGRVTRIERINSGERFLREVAELIQERSVARPVVPDSDGWLKCPHCEVSFTIRDKKAWNGERHVSCTGRLDLK